jgi:hypothetical protein
MTTRRPRAEEFRARHKPGDRVSGRVLERPENGLAWIDFQGLPLLARILSSVIPGQRVLFLIESLHPEILLKQIDPCSHGEDEGITRDLGRFLDLRRGFEERVLERLPLDTLLSERDILKRKLLFRRHVGEETVEGQALLHIETLASQIDASLASTGNRRYLYMPWLLPLARECDALNAPQHPDEHRISLRFRIGAHAAAATLLVRSGRASCRLYLDDKALAGTLCSWVTGWRFGEMPLELSVLDPLPFGSWPGPDPLATITRSKEQHLNLII